MNDFATGGNVVVSAFLSRQGNKAIRPSQELLTYLRTDAINLSLKVLRRWLSNHDPQFWLPGLHDQKNHICAFF